MHDIAERRNGAVLHQLRVFGHNPEDEHSIDVSHSFIYRKGRNIYSKHYLF